MDQIKDRAEQLRRERHARTVQMRERSQKSRRLSDPLGPLTREDFLSIVTQSIEEDLLRSDQENAEMLKGCE